MKTVPAVRGTLVGFEEIDRKRGLVNVTLRLEWSPDAFTIQTGATYLVGFERAYEAPPQLLESSLNTAKGTATDLTDETPT